MKTAIVTLKSISPYSQSRHYVVDKLPGENPNDYERRTWRNRIHSKPDGTVFIPPMAFKNCLSEAAKFISMSVPGGGKATYTKHFEAGVIVMDALDLPVKIDDVSGEWLFVPADGRRGGPKRVDKCFPIIHEWRGDITFHILDEKILNSCADNAQETVFERTLKEAGKFIGIGQFRPRNNGFYGRFEVEAVAWG